MNSAPQQRAHAGHAEDNSRVAMLTEAECDLHVNVRDLIVQSQHRPGQGVDHSRGSSLPGHGGVLGLRRGDGRIGHDLGATDFAVLQPSREPTRADPAQAGRCLVAGQQDECGLGNGVVEGPFQGREVLQQLCPHPVDGAGSVGGEVVATGSEDLQVHRDLVPLLQRLQVPAHPCLIGDDVGVLRIGLAVPAVATGSVVDGSAGDVEQSLSVAGQEGDQ